MTTGAEDGPIATTAGRVDVHAHFLTPSYREALQASGLTMPGGVPVPPWTPELAIEFMDAHAIERQILSVSDPGVNFLAPADAAAMAKECNDHLASLLSAHPARFGGFAVLPTAEIAAAIEEAARALDELRFAGIGLLSSHDGRYLGDPSFEPLLRELDERGAWVFVHPTSPAEDDKPAMPLPDFIAEFPFDTTRTFVSLLTSNCFERFPHIRWHFAHGGGTIPMLRARLNAATAHAKLLAPILGLPEHAAELEPESAEHALRGCFYDTALIADPPSLAALTGICGAERILFGSDWPFAGLMYAAEGDPQPALSAVFNAEDRAAIDRGNAIAQHI